MKNLFAFLLLFPILIHAECLFDGATLTYEDMEEKRLEIPLYQIVDVDYDPEKPCMIYLDDCIVTCRQRELCLNLFLKTNPMFR